MQTVFSHIIQKRFSRSYEDVATDALAFILNSNDAAHSGMMKLLRGIYKNLPDLQFSTQQSEGNIRPDMWGNHLSVPHVFIENKFWAGLTENQPTAYLDELANYDHSTVLLFVGPEAREQTLWRELKGRLEGNGKSLTNQQVLDGIGYSVSVGGNQVLALTSWQRVLTMLEREVANDERAMSDLYQLRALCEAADFGSFKPIAPEEITDQRIPDLILKLGTLALSSSESAVTEGVLNIQGTSQTKSPVRIGRYAWLSNENGVGIWLGIQFELWKKYGGTPFWLIFYQEKWSRADEVRPLLEPWATEHGVFTAWDEGQFRVAITVRTGEEKEQVVRSIVDQLKDIADVLLPLAQEEEVSDDK